MKRLLSSAALLAAFAIAPVQAQQSVDQLLNEVKSGSFEKTKEALDLEKRLSLIHI